MTLLVAVLAADAVVVGADSAATMGALGTQTIRQMTSSKVEVVADRALMAVSGSVGLGQRLISELSTYLTGTKVPSSQPKAMDDLRKRFDPIISGEWKAASAAAPVIGGQTAATSALTHSIVAMCIGGQPALFQFDQQGAPEHATVNLPFVCAGSGMTIADPLMGFHRSTFWEEGVLPTLNQALFAVVWTLAESIALGPQGVSGPIHLYTLTKNGAACVAREVPAAELGEHQQAVQDAKEHFKAFRSLVAGGVIPPIPTPQGN